MLSMALKVLVALILNMQHSGPCPYTTGKTYLQIKIANQTLNVLIDTGANVTGIKTHDWPPEIPLVSTTQSITGIVGQGLPLGNKCLVCTDTEEYQSTIRHLSFTPWYYGAATYPIKPVHTVKFTLTDVTGKIPQPPTVLESWELVWVEQWPLKGEKLQQIQILVKEQLNLGHGEPSTSPGNTPFFRFQRSQVNGGSSMR